MKSHNRIIVQEPDIEEVREYSWSALRYFLALVFFLYQTWLSSRLLITFLSPVMDLKYCFIPIVYVSGYIFATFMLSRISSIPLYAIFNIYFDANSEYVENIHGKLPYSKIINALLILSPQLIVIIDDYKDPQKEPDLTRKRINTDLWVIKICIKEVFAILRKWMS